MSSARRRAVTAAPALLVLLAGAVAFLAPRLRIPGDRGATRIVDGFRPGRWDARFVVARGGAALHLPRERVALDVWLSGPARVTLGEAAAPRVVTLSANPSRVALALPGGGDVAIAADATIRLHEIVVTRQPSASDGWRLLALALVCLAATGVCLRSPSRAASAAAFSVAVSTLTLLARGRLAGLVLAVWWERLAPIVALLALTLSFRVVWRLPRSARASAAVPLRLPALFAAAMFVSCLLQAFTREQPQLIGDPAAYHEIGGRFRDAISAVRSVDDLAYAVKTLRPYGGLVFTGLLYGTLRLGHDALGTIYAVQSGAMALALFFLMRAALRLGGARLGLLVGPLALLYPTFVVLCGIVQPEPFILLLWTFALDRMLGHDGRRSRDGALAGLAFGSGLALHPQGIWFLLLAFGLVLLPFVRTLRATPVRGAVVAFAIGLLPVALVTLAGEAYARETTPVLDERHGFWAYTAAYPLGFWLFLDTDGWQGPMRIDDTRYARALRDAEARGEIGGGVGRWAFTGRFVASHAAASARTVLRNMHRLFHVPDNPGRVDWLVPYPWQLRAHRALVVLFLLCVPLVVPGRGAVLLLPFAMLSITYPLYHVFNKYAVPATPFLLLGAAVVLLRLFAERRLGLVAALALAGAGAAIPASTPAFLGVPPLGARALLLAVHLLGLGVAFGLAAKGFANGRLARGLTALAGLALVLPTLAAEWGDPRWRQFGVALEQGASHRVQVEPADVERLDAASEAYLLLDLALGDGDPRGLALQFASGLQLNGDALTPTMPSFGLATTRFGRDPRSFRQWWRVAWQPAMIKDGRVDLEIRGRAGQVLYGALDDGGGQVNHDLSLGQWPYLSVYRLMHDGEYRLAADVPWTGGSRESRLGGAAIPGVLGVRLVAVDEDRGGASWETAPVPQTARGVVTAVWAKASSAGEAELSLPDASVRFRFGARATVASWPSGELRFAPTGDSEGWYLLRLRAPTGAPLRLRVRPRAEMASPARAFEPRFREAPPIPLDWTAFPYVPMVKLVESRVVPWKPAAVY